MTTARVKSYPTLALAAMRQKQEALYRVWLLARALDVSGRGAVGVRELGALCEDERVCSRESLARVLRQGNGSYWHTGSGGVCYVSLFKLCDLLGTRPGRPVWIDLDLLRALRTFRAALVQSAMNHVTISKATLRKLTGRSTSALTDYLRRKRTKTRPVLCDRVLTVGNVWRSERPLSDYATLSKDDRRWFVALVAGKPRLCQRMANSYIGQFGSAAVGQVRKYRPSFSTGAGRQRLYFENAKAACRAMQRHQETLYVRTTANDIRLDAKGAGMYQVWRKYQLVPDMGYQPC